MAVAESNSAARAAKPRVPYSVIAARRVYTKLKPEDLHKGPAAVRRVAAQHAAANGGEGVPAAA